MSESEMLFFLNDNNKVVLQCDDSNLIVTEMTEGKHQVGNWLINLRIWDKTYYWLYPIIPPIDHLFRRELGIERSQAAALIEINTENSVEEVYYVPRVMRLSVGYYFRGNTKIQSLGLFDPESGMLLFDLLERAYKMSKDEGSNLRLFFVDCGQCNHEVILRFTYTDQGLIRVTSQDQSQVLFSIRELDGTQRIPHVVSDKFEFSMDGQAWNLLDSQWKRRTAGRDSELVRDVFQFLGFGESDT